MANRFRAIIQSVVYAGMKPGARTAPSTPVHNAGVSGALKSFLLPRAPSDPLYLTNRTFGQKARSMLLLAVPVIVIGGSVVFGMAHYAITHPKVVKILTNKEIADFILPGFAEHIKLEQNDDLEVVEVRLDHSGGDLMAGSLKNLTDHVIAEAVVVCDLVDASGSQLGGVTVTETNLPARAKREFKRPIEQTAAERCVVREVRTR